MKSKFSTSAIPFNPSLIKRTQMLKNLKRLTFFFIFYSVNSYSLTFNFNNVHGIDNEYMTAFNTAGNIWGYMLQDDVTVNIDIISAKIEKSTTIMHAASSKQVVSYEKYANALINDETSLLDYSATGTLDYSLEYTGVGITGYEAKFDAIAGSVGSRSNHTESNLRVNTANLKALGIYDGPSDNTDATITFSPDFDWDLNVSDGIGSCPSAGFWGYDCSDPGSVYELDFVGVAMHEIGHALGFVSGLDGMDVSSLSFEDYADKYSFLEPLDLFRYDSSGEKRIWNPGDGDHILSADGGQTMIHRLSTGTDNGNGNQASHFHVDAPALMNPIANWNDIIDITTYDTDALDIIGWDVANVAWTNRQGGCSATAPSCFTLTPPPNYTTQEGIFYEDMHGEEFDSPEVSVPEPPALALMGLGLLGFAATRRKLQDRRSNHLCGSILLLRAGSRPGIGAQEVIGMRANEG